MAEVPLPTPTQVPVPSTDIRNAVFAGAKLDEEVTGSGEYYTDRLGVNRLTNTGRNNQFNTAQQERESRFNEFIQNSGYEVIGDYTAGPLTLTEYNQLIRYNNELYKLTAATDIPFTTTGNTDETWISTDAAHFVSVGDAALRQELGSSAPGNGGAIIALEQGGTVQDAIFHITPGMFGYTPDFNITSQTGTDNGPALRQAIAKAIALGCQIVEIPAGFALIDVALEDVNLGGQGFKGYQGVKLVGAGQRNTRLFFRGPAGSVGISNIGGSGSISQKSLHGIGLSTTNDSVRNINLYLLDGCCFSHNSDLWLLNGASGIKFSNSGTSGSFTEFNTFTNSRVQNCADNIIFEVNGGDNSFHGNSFTNVQNQVLAGAIFGNGIRVNGITSPAYLYNQTWDMKFFGGTNCRAYKLTNCNTDNLSGNLSFEGNLICETTDASFFEFKGNFSGISTLAFNVVTHTTVRAANFIFNNVLDDFSSFSNAALSSYSPRLFNPQLADTTDNGVTASVWRVRNAVGDGLLFNVFNGSPGWFFSTTQANQRTQAAAPKYSLGPDGNSFTGYSSTLYLKEGANKQVISSQADSLIKISRIWADFFPANTSNQPI